MILAPLLRLTVLLMRNLSCYFVRYSLIDSLIEKYFVKARVADEILSFFHESDDMSNSTLFPGSLKRL